MSRDTLVEADWVTVGVIEAERTDSGRKARLPEWGTTKVGVTMQSLYREKQTHANTEVLDTCKASGPSGSCTSPV